jgi:hypothetical protein
MFKATILSRMYFSYYQFMIADANVQELGCKWTAAHTSQGFARRDDFVSFNTLLQFGDAIPRVVCGPVMPDSSYERAISVPLYCDTGQLQVVGIEEFDVVRHIKLDKGHYRVTAAQVVSGEEELILDIFLERLDAPLSKSVIVLADSMLSPPTELIEWSEVPDADKK